MRLKKMIKQIPGLGPVFSKLNRMIRSNKSFSSQGYWINRYQQGGDSGAGSYKNLARFKAKIINSFIQDKGIKSVIEFGCGDGNQLKLLEPDHYLGFDISPITIEKCKEIFRHEDSRKFKLLGEYAGEKADLTISLDVIYHLVEDDIFDQHMKLLFNASDKYVIVYSSNSNDHENNGVTTHVKHRKFTDWIDQNAPDFQLMEYIPNEFPFNGDGTVSSYADFYIFKKLN